MASVIITRRALRDIRAIQQYSLESWGNNVAKEYKDAIHDAIQLIQERPGILMHKDDISKYLQFNPVRKHLLVCQEREGQYFIIAVIYGGRDLPERLVELESDFKDEIGALSQAFGAAEKKRKQSAKKGNPLNK
jgi:plasmid stabilization system protein ParE